MALNAATIIARNSLFRSLPEQTITQITALASRRSYKPDSVVFMRGDPGDALYGVVTGRVRISVPLTAAATREDAPKLREEARERLRTLDAQTP